MVFEQERFLRVAALGVFASAFAGTGRWRRLSLRGRVVQPTKSRAAGNWDAGGGERDVRSLPMDAEITYLGGCHCR